MFTWKKNESSELDETITQLIRQMDGFTGDQEEYATMVDQLDKLYKLRQNDKPDRVSKDTLAIVAGNLVGILVIVGYEQRHVITTKALSFILRTR